MPHHVGQHNTVPTTTEISDRIVIAADNVMGDVVRGEGRADVLRHILFHGQLLDRLISDRASVFIGDVFAELLRQWTIKPRLGAVGKKGSIAVTERVIKTLKYEWLRCVPLIKGFDHLTSLCTEFESWYNGWRPHMTLEGLRPDDLYYDRKPEQPRRDAKTVPGNIERHVFAETRLIAYRLKNAA